MKNEENKYERIYKLTGEHIKVNDYDKAMNYADQLREMEPNLWKSWEITGRVHYKSGDIGLAAKFFEKAIQLDDTIAFAHANLGLSQYNLQNYVESYHAYCECLTIDPTFKQALNFILKMIKQELIVFTSVDDSISFFESINERNNSDIVHQILSELYCIKAMLFYPLPEDNFSDETYYHSEENFQEFMKAIDTAKTYFNNEKFDKKIGEAYFNKAKQEVITEDNKAGLFDEKKIHKFIELVEQAQSFDKENEKTYLAIIAAAKKKLRKKFDKSKLVFFILAVYYALMRVTPLSHIILWVVIGGLALYASYRARYNLDRLKILGEVKVPVFDHITKGYYAISHRHVIIQIIFWLVILSIPDVLYGLFHLQFLQ